MNEWDRAITKGGQGNASVVVDLPGALELSANYGRLEALRGEFHAHVVEASLGYRLTVFGRGAQPNE